MTVLSLLAATFTFTATATGVEKGAPIEFAFVGKGSDRDYESLFVLEGSIDDFCKGLESVGFPRGKPEDLKSCSLWPIGCTVTFDPPLSNFLDSKLPDDSPLVPVVYTGGTRMSDGRCEASTNMPLAAFCLYSLAQSPLVYNTHYEQGNVYNSHLCKTKMEKGTPVKFSISCDVQSKPKPLSLTLHPGQSTSLINKLRDEAKLSEVDACIDFSPDLSVSESVRAAQALSVVDSSRVRINGVPNGRLFYRAFLPLVKWRDRQQRLVQPFELTIGATNTLVHIEEDWTVEGDDPKLTPHVISTSDAARYQKTDTCFIFAESEAKLSSVYQVMESLKDSKVRTWYVFVKETH